MDIKLQNDMPDTTPVVPVVPAEEEAPVVAAPEAPMPEATPPVAPVPGAPAEGGDPTVA